MNGLNLHVSSLFTTCLIRCLATRDTRISMWCASDGPHRTVINHRRRETQSKYGIRHTFGWTQGGMTYHFLITGHCFPRVFRLCLLPLPYKYCLCRFLLSCIQYYSMHFQPSQSYKYLVYRLLMFIQSTGLHCLGKIARRGPSGKEKENVFQMKSNDSCHR